MKHLTAIDGLRAVAVLAVVAYHAGLPVPAGFVGVDVFFVISGYLITRLLHEELQTGRIDFMAFYARRARRILPALALVILVTLGLSLLLLPDAGDVAKSAAAAGAFVANLWFQAQTSDYWATSSEQMPLLHLWSLSVEEQFYLVWPVVLVLARRKPVAALATLALCSLALAEWWLWRAPSVAFYAMPARAWELALGGLVALRPVRGSAWGGLALVVVACFVPFSHFPGVGALPAGAGAALLIAGIQSGQRIAVLESRPVVYVGLISYSLYLWHWPLLALANARMDTPTLGLRLAFVALAFGLAALSFHCVETPFRRKGSNRRAVMLAGLCVTVLTTGGWAMSLAPPLDEATRVAIDHPANRDDCHQAARAEPAYPDACLSRSGTPSVVGWGDSMAMSWEPFTYSLGNVAASYTRDSCPPVLGYTMRGPLCTAWEAGGFARAQNAQAVVLGAKWNSYFRRDPDFAGKLDATLAKLRGRTVYVIGPTPELPRMVPKCIKTGDLAPCRISRQAFERANQADTLRAIAERNGAVYVDPVDFFCDATDCPAVRNGVALYFDTHHITTTAAKAFALGYRR